MRIKTFIFVMNLLSVFGLYSQTFPGQGNLPFPPTGTVGITESEAPVNGVGILGGCVQIDNVTLNMTHTFTGDIAVILIAPDGTTFLELFSQNGGGGDNLQITEFRDDAPLNVVLGAPPYNGQFQPEGRQNTTIFNPYPNTNPPGTFTFANSFNGINADGNWTLFLNDFVGADQGVLIDWSITFTSNGTDLNVDAGNDQTICAGETITLSADAPGATNYTWSSGENSQDIDVSPLTTTTYVVTATNGACTGTDEVEVEVIASPNAFTTSINACDIGDGTGNFLLEFYENIINGGSGLQVNWFSDAGGTNPIPVPNGYNSPSGFVYASVGISPCLSALVPIELTVIELPDFTLLDFTASPDAGCGETEVEFNFNQPGNSQYTINVNIINSSGSVTTTWDINNSPTQFYTVNETTTFNIAAINDVLTGCFIFIPFGTFTHEIIIDAPPEIFLNNLDPICEGETVDLNDYAFSNSPNGVTFHSDTPATPGNELSSSVVTLSSTTTFYVFSEGVVPDCNAEEPLEIEVNPLVSIALDNSITCEHDVFDLNTLFTTNIIDGEWSGNGVDNNFLDPTGLSGIILVSFDPDEDCFLPVEAEVEIIPTILINLDDAEVCESGQIINLQNLQDPNYPDGEWDGEGVTGNNFNPSGLDGEIILTFTGDYQCALPATTIITVYSIIIPQLGSLDYCENETPFDLTLLEDFNYPGGTWNGEGVTNGEFDPTGLSGEILLTYEITEDCAEIGETFINVIELQSPVIDNDYWCTSIGVLDLNDLEDPDFPNGTWSGDGVNNNFFDPTGLSGDVELTFQSNDYCTNEVSIVLTLINAAVPDISDALVCETETSFDLTALEDPLFNDGFWQGNGVVGGNTFDATGITGNVDLEFISNNGCVENGVATLSIDQAYSPILNDTLICENSQTLDLVTLQDVTLLAGVWSGPGVSNNQFNPQNLSGSIQLTFDADDYCTNIGTSQVVIQSVVTPSLIDTILCENSTELDLSLLNADSFNDGAWFGNGIINDTFNPLNLSGTYQLSFISNDFCTDTASTTVQVNETISVFNINIVCNITANTYTVSFDVIGGVGDTYLVNNNASASQFVSQPIFSETDYSFQINDVNNCNLVSLTGNKNCSCATTSGTMDIPNDVPLVCVNDIFIANHNGDENLDVDTFLFVLHDNAGLSLGTIYGISDKPEFSFPANGELGKTYYVSAIAGNKLAQFVDLTDPCVSIAQGSPVQFYEIDYAPLSSETICKTECVDYNLNLQGQAPFKIYATIKKANFSILDTFETQTTSLSFTICPDQYNFDAGVYEFIINKIEDSQCETIIPASNGSTFITVNPERINNINSDICKGESLVVAGKIYDENFLSGTEIITASNNDSCDSIINVNLNLLLPSEIAINKQLCEGEIFTINGTVYNENNLSGIEIFQKAAANGCDSIVNVSLEYTQAITNNFSDELCNGESVLINGVVYDDNNPSGTEIITNGSTGGCDSIINVSLEFLPNASNNIIQLLCRDESITVNGKIFDINNSSGSELIQKSAANGCDSLITINLSFYNEAKVDISQTICKDENLTIEGTVFDFNNQNGQIITQTINGCDSTINVELRFFNDVISQRQEFICENDSVIFNNEVFNINNPDGEFMFENGSVNGCDSTLLFKLNFYPIEYDTVEYEFYFGDSLLIGDYVLSADNTQIEAVFFGEGEFGCDIRRLLVGKIIKKDVNIVLPNIISPSSGNGNNEFTILTSDDFIPLEYSIYDRWGNKVFAAKANGNIIQSWDGRINGQYPVPGVYIYYISYTNIEGEIETLVGDLTVVR